MGSVTESTVTGDNDPDIYPREYTRRYFYCNQCGSFKLKFISLVKQAPPPQNTSWPVTLLSCSVVLALLFCIFWVVFDLILDMVHWGYLVPIWFVVSVYGLYRYDTPSAKKPKGDGLHCENCHQEYLFGSAFFTKKTNPKRFTVDDIPPASEQPYWEDD